MRWCRCGARHRRGAAVVELAVVLPVFCTMIFGMIEFARIGMVNQVLTAAARTGCRQAILNTSQTTAQVLAPMNALLAASKINVPALSPVDADPGTAGAFISPSNWNATDLPRGTAVTVVVRVRYSDVKWLPMNWFVSDSTLLTGQAVMTAERP